MIKTPWFYGWNIVALGMLFQAITFGIAIYSATFWVVPWTEEFSAPRADVLQVMMFMQLAMGVISPVAGRAMDRVPIGFLVCIGAFFLATGLLLISISESLWQIGLIYALLLPVGIVLSGPLAAQTLAAKWFQENRGLAIGITAIGTSIGGFLIPPLVTVLQASYGWRGTHVVLAVMVLLLVVPLTWLVLQRGPSAPKETAASPSGPHHLTRSWTTREIFAERAFWVPILAFVPLSIAFNSLQFNFGAIANDAGISKQTASSLVSFMAVCMIGGKLFFGGFSDKWDHRVLFWITAASMFCAVLFFRLPADVGTVFVGMAFLGIAGGGFLPLMGAIVASRFGPAAFGQVQGLIGPFMTLGAFGAPFAGWIFDRTGSYDLALTIIMITVIPSAAAMAFLPPRKDLDKVVTTQTAPLPAALNAEKTTAPTPPPPIPGEQQNGTNPGMAGPSPGNNSVSGTTHRGPPPPSLAE